MNFTYKIETQNKQGQTVSVIYTPETFPVSEKALPTMRIVNYLPTDTQEMLHLRILAACPKEEWERALELEAPDFELAERVANLNDVAAAVEELAPVPGPGQMIMELKQRIAVIRYHHEIGGMLIDGISIDTDRESQALLTGACLQAMRDESYELKWKTPTGFVLLGAAEIIAIAEAVRGHVQACFDREAELLSEVDAGTYRDEMLQEGWPDYAVD